ncbi:MAG TPA: MmcQ/YjbR family DNA-binding protein [Acidimicrobiales bacterium]|nr:MAG: hypothetical protein B7Z69_08205 [Actinobacteria bacterium 21-73-9]HQU26692.1 MmcQ/YjbR family DNA-binding protein [Acidimicrobiales bacterium]
MTTRRGPRGPLDEERLAAFLLDFPETTQVNPFGPGVDVYTVAGKVFALLSGDPTTPSISLKCDPARALALRATYPAVTAGYHLNKAHWNTVRLDGTVPDDELLAMVEHSFDRVVAGLPRAVRTRLEQGPRPTP